MDIAAIGHYIVVNNGVLIDRVMAGVLCLIWYNQRSMRRRLNNLEHKVYEIPGSEEGGA